MKGENGKVKVASKRVSGSLLTHKASEAGSIARSEVKTESFYLALHLFIHFLVYRKVRLFEQRGALFVFLVKKVTECLCCLEDF